MGARGRAAERKGGFDPGRQRELRTRCQRPSCWEVAKLVEVGRLGLPFAVDEWLDRALAYPGVTLIDLSVPIVVESTRLGGFHRDPADQMLVATSRVLGVPLATADRRIVAYDGVETLDLG